MMPTDAIFFLLDKLTAKIGPDPQAAGMVLEISRLLRGFLEENGKEIDRLKNEVARLESRLNNNSNNCGVTTAVERSSCTANRNSEEEDGADPDGKGDGAGEKSPNEYNGRKASADTGKRKPGGQPGHKGSTMTADQAKALVRKLERMGIKPEVVNVGDPTASGDYRERYLIGFSIVPHVTVMRCYKNADGTYAVPAEMPHNSTVAYGGDVLTLVNYLRTVCNLPIGKIAGLLSDMTDGLIDMSEGTAANSVRYFSDSCAESIDSIIEHLLNAGVLYTDATYTFKSGDNAYIRNLSTNERVLYTAMDSKSLEALKKLEVLPEYHGILVHDHEVVMYHFGREHGECIIHVMRYCRKDIEAPGTLSPSN